MPLDAPTNCWTNAEATLVTAISNSASFQLLTGETAAVDALNHIFLESLDLPANGETYTAAELANLVATAVITSTDETPYGIVGRGAKGSDTSWFPVGRLLVVIEEAVDLALYDNGKRRDEVKRRAKNRIGLMMKEIWKWCWEMGSLLPAEIAVDSGPMFNKRTAQEDEGVLLRTVLIVSWNGGSRQ